MARQRTGSALRRGAATPRRVRPDHVERGASTVEYILLVMFVTMIVSTGVKVLGEHSSSRLAAATPQIAGTDAPADQSVSMPAGADSIGGGGSVGGDTTPVSTAPTTPPTSAPPDTAPPTTVPTATLGGAGFGTANAKRSGSQWSASSTIAVTDDLGSAVPEATVDVTIRAYTKGKNNSWSWKQTTRSLTTGPDGSVVLTAGPYRWSGSSQVTTIEIVVDDVVLPAGLTWNGVALPVDVDRP